MEGGTETDKRTKPGPAEAWVPIILLPPSADSLVLASEPAGPGSAGGALFEPPAGYTP